MKNLGTLVTRSGSTTNHKEPKTRGKFSHSMSLLNPLEQSTSAPANIIGCKYSADVVKRFGQCILVLREDISSFTDAVIIKDEKANTLREGLIQLISHLRSRLSPPAVVRTGPASGLRSLKDKYLAQLKVSLELGEAKNVNHNPIAENCI